MPIFFSEAVNEDMFKRLLLQSNPLISLQRGFPKRKKQEFTPEMINLFSEDVSDEE